MKALATPREAALFDRVIINPNDAKTTIDTTSPNLKDNAKTTIDNTSPNLKDNAETTIDNTSLTLKEDKNTSHRISLLDQMLAEDNAATKILRSPDTKEIDSNSTTKLDPYGAIEPLEKIVDLGRKNQDDTAAVESLAIVPTKKHGVGSLWRKLLWRKKKGNSKKTPLPFPS